MSTATSFKSRMGFIIFALMLHAFCAALVSGGLMRVYHMAVAYEYSSPEYVARRVLALFQEAQYAEILRKSGVSLSEFETPDDFGAAVKKRYGDSFTLERTGADSWRVLGGGKPVAELDLHCKKGEGKYGLDIWQTERLSLTIPKPESYTVQSPQTVVLTVNGKALDNRYLAEHNEAVQSPFGELPEALAPKASAVYQIAGLYAPPVVIAKGPNGEDCPVAHFENNFSVTLLPDQKLVTQLSAFGEQAACAYAKFITNDATLDEVLPFFLPEAPYYTHLKQFYNGWYNEHDAYAFKNAAFSEWRAYDDGHVSCDIAFDYWIKMGRREFTYPSRYTMYFVKGTNGWRVANLIVR